MTLSDSGIGIGYRNQTLEGSYVNYENSGTGSAGSICGTY